MLEFPKGTSWGVEHCMPVEDRLEELRRVTAGMERRLHSKEVLAEHKLRGTLGPRDRVKGSLEDPMDSLVEGMLVVLEGNLGGKPEVALGPMGSLVES
jgi:hypothetical protein